MPKSTGVRCKRCNRERESCQALSPELQTVKHLVNHERAASDCCELSCTVSLALVTKHIQLSTREKHGEEAARIPRPSRKKQNTFVQFEGSTHQKEATLVVPNIMILGHAATTVQSARIESACVKHSCPLLHAESSLMNLTRAAAARLMLLQDSLCQVILMTSLIKMSDMLQAARGFPVSV